MRTKFLWGAAVVCLAVVVLPVLLTNLFPAQSRALTGVDISETSFEEVHFYNDAQELDLAGMLFLPDDAGPVPGVVIIHGAGTSRRNNRWYLTLTTHLQERGIAVLLPDKRGSELSDGDWHSASFFDLATDADAAISFLRQTYPERIGPIGVLGSSQGGQVVPIVATQSDDVAFAINLVGSVVPFHEALQYEENLNLRQAGLLPGVSNGVAYLSSAYIRNVGQKEFWTVIGNYDPLPYWADMDVPGLAVFGADDTNTPSEESAARLVALNNPNVRVEVFDGSGHALEDPVGTGDNVIRADVLSLVSDFILAAAAEK